MKPFTPCFNLAFVVCSAVYLASACAPRADEIQFATRKRAETAPGTNQWQFVNERVKWDGRFTAAIICDMWDVHWCKGASSRVAELAPHMNQLINHLRKQGVLIIHCPSGTIKFYENTPGRQLAKSAPKAEPVVPLKSWCGIDPAKEPPLPIDDSDGGCDDQPRCKEGSPWTRQIAAIGIEPADAITDSAEAYNLMRQRGITNVLVMGVHQNMCVLGRPFAIRQMVSQGLNVVLVRDMTDSMYNSRSKPFVNHFAGNDLVTEHIEKYWCPTTTSSEFLEGPAFRFSADHRYK